MFLNTDQFKQLSHAVHDLDPYQLAWVEGYLHGLGTQKRQSISAEPTIHLDQQAVAPTELANTPQQQDSITLLYATQTGNSKKVAEQLNTQLSSLGREVNLLNIKDYRPKQLKKEQQVIVIVSTHGNGEPPDEARGFFKYILGNRAPELKHLKYAVLALGDSSYDEFCQAGGDLDKRFQELGATPLLERGELDLDFADTAPAWQQQLLEKLPVQDNLIQFPHTAAHENTDTQANTDLQADVEVLEHICLTTDESNKAVYHIEFDIEESGLSYQPGDIAVITVHNNATAIKTLLETAQLDGNASVTIGQDTLSLEQALLNRREITQVTRKQLQQYADAIQSESLNEAITNQETTWLGDADWVDVLSQYPNPLDAQAFVNLLRPLQPREYSIASSPEQHSDELHLLVKHVQYNHLDRAHEGAGSTWISQLEAGDKATIRIKPNPHFKLPESNETPIIMIGAGTGVAPFRSFIAERDSLGANDNSWLFFGEQTFRHDFLYQAEWLQHLKSKSLSKLSVAFSRDQEERIYVQNKLQENAADVYQWIQDGAHIYVCGDMNRMAKDVHNTLIDIITNEGKMSQEQAESYLDNLLENKRYQRDIY